MEFYGDKARLLRKKAKLSLEESAKKLSIFRTTLSAWENGVRRPSESKIRSLAKALNISVDQISDLKPDKPLSSTNFAESVASITSKSVQDQNSSQNTINSVLSGINIIHNELKNAKIVIEALSTSLASIFYIKDTKLRYVMANHLFLENISLDKNISVFNKIDNDFFPLSEAKRNEEEDRQVILSGESIINKEGYIPGSRKTKWGLISKIPVYDSESKIKGVVGSFSDITERKRTEEAIAQANEKNLWLLECLDLAPVYIYIKDKESRYVHVNKKTLELFNCSLEDVKGATNDKFFSLETTKRIQKIDKRVLELGEVTEEEVLVEMNGRKQALYLERKHPLRDKDGKIWGLCGVSTDITERKYV